jgi:hypothetical protein
MTDHQRPPNVIELKRPAPPVRTTSAMVLDGLELARVFLTIRSAFERKRILALAREIAQSDANTKA